MSDDKPIRSGTRVISRKDLADLWGVSINTIDVMRQQGKIRTLATGLFDYDHAVAFRAGQDPSRGAIAKQINPRGKVPGAKPDPAAEGEDSEEEISADAKTAQEALQARTEKMRAQAELAELRLREANGELLNRVDVKRASFNAASVLNNGLTGLGTRLGPRLTMRPADEIEEILNAELRAVARQFFEDANRLVPEGVGLDIDEVWPAPKPSPEARRR